MNTVKRKIMRQVILFFTFFLLTFTLISCDLFNAPVNKDYLANIDAEIAWANAAKLAVRVDYPPEWGASPQQGDLNRDNTRKGYSFNVEFTPLPGYGFEKWLAFPSTEYNSLEKTKTARDIEASALNDTGVNITFSEGPSGAKIATVTIFTEVPVTLVPWCSKRPALDQKTNPPLNPILTPFPFNQQVNLWFTMPIKTSTISLSGENPTIRVTGIWASGNERGQPFNKNNENGDLRNYFDIEFPTASDPTNPQLNNRVNLIPKANAADIALLTVTVTVGPGIESSSGVAMTNPALISFQTDTTEARKVYRAGNVRASDNSASGYFRDAEFSRPDIDRRFTQNTNNTKNTVYIRFEVEAPPEAPDNNPNKIIIVERRLYSLRGFDLNPGTTNETTYLYPGPGVSLAGGEFTITHTLETALSGIVQLVVLPWYDGSPSVEEMPVNEAVTEGCYVTIVMDNAAPDVETPQPSVSAPSSIDEGVNVYGLDVPMTLTLSGLSGIVDNGDEGGIAASRAYSLPWTMDESENLYWYAMIGENATTVKIQMPRQAVNTNTWTLANLSTLEEGDEYSIYVKYEDTLGNITTNWTATGLRVMYSKAEKETVTNVKAFCNTAGNSITVSYIEPAGWASVSTSYPYPEIVITTYRAGASGDIEEGTQTYTRTRGAGAYSFTVPQIVTNRVRDGEEVSNVHGYKISVITHNIAGDMTAGPIWVYNIPDMATNSNKQIAIINEQLEMCNEEIRAVLADAAISTIVLTSNITLDNWEPVDLTGKFYGNGHTVTITSISGTDDNRGLFSTASGTTTNPAIIRDLTLVYANPSALSVDAAAVTSIGGIVGSASGNTQILNCIVQGTSNLSTSALSTCALSVNGTGGGTGLVDDEIATIRIGGIAGYFEGSGIIENCCAALSVAYEATDAHTGHVRIGGIAGETGTGGNSSISFNNGIGNVTLNDVLINGVTIAADVSADKKSNPGVLYVGGAVGSSGNNTMQNIEFTEGTVSFFRTFTTTSNITRYDNYIGGLIGNSVLTNVLDSSFYGSIGTIGQTESTTPTINGILNVGGLIGYNITDASSNYYINNCTTQGNIKFDSNNLIYIGGIFGHSEIKNGTMIITNSFFEGGNITVSGDVYTQAGSFGGYLTGDHAINNCGTLEGTLDLSTTGNSIYAGGFTSQHFQGTISKCFSRINIITKSVDTGNTNVVSVGGFVGWLYGSSSINNCYASGNVRVVQNGNTNSDGVNAGGLIGRTLAGTTISNSYALGNVLADKQGGTGGDLYAGGLVGRSGSDIINSFSTGQLSAQSATTAAYAGGLAGYRGAGIISYSAALGAKVIAAAGIASVPRSSAAGRIAGYAADSINQNRANELMRTGDSVNYISGLDYLKGDISYIISRITGTEPTTNINHNQINGGNASMTMNFTASAYWQNTLGFGTTWNFDIPYLWRAYPLLIGISGQE